MNRFRAGLGYGTAAYFIWGSFPFYFGLIVVVHPLEVVPWRVASTLIFCALVVTAFRGWRRVGAILRSWRSFGWFALSSVLLYINWQVFVLAVMTGHVLEAALGYFINPLFTILVGVVFRKESLRRLQWVAVTIAAVGVIASAIAYGAFPWIAITLAVSFGLYGVVHKHSGENVDGLTGLTVETFVAVPIAGIQLVIVGSIFGLNGLTHGSWITMLLIFSGVMTAIPLILFGEATRRLPLSYIGFLQFLTPVLAFLYGYFIDHEDMSLGRWIGFVAVWIALTLLIIDMVRQLRSLPANSVTPLTGPIPLD